MSCSPILTLVLMAVTSLIAGKGYGQTVHVLLASDAQNDTLVSAAAERNSQADIENMQRLFRTNIPAKQLNIVLLQVEEPRSEMIVYEIDKLEIRSEDAIVFYYSGLGREENRDENLDGRGRLGRKEIREALSKKSPRLSVIATDCCNVGIPLNYLIPSPKPEKEPSSTSPLFQTLFLQSRGNVDIASRPPVGCPRDCGQVERSRFDGSCFTTALIEYLNMHKTLADLEWKTVVGQIDVKTLKGFRGNCPRRCKGPSEECLRVFSLPGQEESIKPFCAKNEPSCRRMRFRLGMRTMSGENGLNITEIVSGSPAEKKGFQVGDTILEINGKPVSNEEDYARAVDSSNKTMQVKMKPSDGDKTETETIDLEW